MRRAMTMVITAAVGILLGAACARAGETTKLFSLESAARPARLAPGQQGVAEVRVRVKSGAHVSEEAPLKLLATGQNLTPAREKLGRADARYDETGASFEVPFTSGAKGQASLDAELTFYICKKDLCEREVHKLSIPVTVE